MLNPEFWHQRKVMITGCTGFKGAWLSIWLHKLGACVTGFALEPDGERNLFRQCRLDRFVNTIYGDVRNYGKFKWALEEASPEIIIHMAAQPIVRESYRNPLKTYATNVMGTVHLFEAVRKVNDHKRQVLAVLNVTTDKCYENREWIWGYRENEPLGGSDPYSSSKACSELVTSSYRNSFFSSERYAEHGVAVASARAGNVIGGGDWAADRLIPDCVRAVMEGRPLELRYPDAVRPWQHVLDPLYGYMLLAEKLATVGPEFAEAWNFGPGEDELQTVEWMAGRFCKAWGEGVSYRNQDNRPELHESRLLRLDCSKAMGRLGWRSLWHAGQSVDKVVEWTKGYMQKEDPYDICLRQIEQYTNELADNSHSNQLMYQEARRT
ncbi:CDP-glucose 4,6-dehydratase [Paenibacillus sophorae]|uniref:CDP-glucose 4,6-dehydratase n=1 Tax=Paenibacillus sophorae TaxID=1333845 RepID=A0A1H8UF35_9BACL|nr:CDP-glucose 4,6-dehydratase [Paenibacillus sophorae]QWU13150.1 CDP-glucose 4,6-dehydratase [Paenibacillus sophorae]SEP01872.1 CDP-glucose 4,6-dehydratase [Paenibacillus sophorae]